MLAGVVSSWTLRMRSMDRLAFNVDAEGSPWHRAVSTAATDYSEIRENAMPGSGITQFLLAVADPEMVTA
jgi:hypothetical protein